MSRLLPFFALPLCALNASCLFNVAGDRPLSGNCYLSTAQRAFCALRTPGARTMLVTAFHCTVRQS